MSIDVEPIHARTFHVVLRPAYASAPIQSSCLSSLYNPDFACPFICQRTVYVVSDPYAFDVDDDGDYDGEASV